MAPVSKVKTSRFERVANLALALMQTENPLSLERLVHDIPGYPNGGDEATMRMAFERDKRILRDQSLDILSVESGTSHGVGYFIAPSLDSEKPLLQLNHDQMFHLAFALGTFRFEDDHARNALLKLVCCLPSVELHYQISRSTRILLQGAIDTRRSVRLFCNERSFDLDPYGIVQHVNGWQVVGRDRHFEGVRVRSFASTDITSVLLGRANSYEPPSQFDPTANLDKDPAQRFNAACDELSATPNRAINAGERFGRLMAILSFLATAERISTEELATFAQLRVSDLISELETAACFGVAPYTPDQLLDICVDNDTVQGRDLENFRHPLDLNSDEVTAAIKAARSLLSFASPLDTSILRSTIAECEKYVSVSADEGSAQSTDWPSEWSTLVRLKMSEIVPWFERLVVDEPVATDDNSRQVVAFLADRRWQNALLEALGDRAELIDPGPSERRDGLDKRRPNCETA